MLRGFLFIRWALSHLELRKLKVYNGKEEEIRILVNGFGIVAVLLTHLSINFNHGFPMARIDFVSTVVAQSDPKECKI